MSKKAISQVNVAKVYYILQDKCISQAKYILKLLLFDN